MHSDVSHPTRRCPQSLRKCDRREKPWNLLQSDEQVLGRVGHCGLMERSSNAHNF